MSTGTRDDAGWMLLHLLAEPTRRRVFDEVRAGRQPMTREEVAEGTGISRRLAAFHLDVLAESGLLDVDFARPPGRGGPGAGRPAKRYRAADREVSVSVPARRYDVVARVLAAGIRDAKASRRDAGDSALDVAEEEGRRIGVLRRPAGRVGVASTVRGVTAALDDLGYEPASAADGLRLRNCPFHAVVDVAPELVCGLNERFLCGLLEGMGGHPDVTAQLDPAPPDCCVVVRTRPPAS